jgi:hypothetical protein
MTAPTNNGWADALLGNVYTDGNPVELAGGINFVAPLRASNNSSSGQIDVVIDPTSALGYRVVKKKTAFTGNVGATPIASANPPAGMYRASGTLVYIVAGTAGTAALDIEFTDEAGAFTRAICASDISTGVRASGEYIFRTTGGALTFSITGITTAGPLSGQYELVLEALDLD